MLISKFRKHVYLGKWSLLGLLVLAFATEGFGGDGVVIPVPDKFQKSAQLVVTGTPGQNQYEKFLVTQIPGTLEQPEKGIGYPESLKEYRGRLNVPLALRPGTYLVEYERFANIIEISRGEVREIKLVSINVEPFEFLGYWGIMRDLTNEVEQYKVLFKFFVRGFRMSNSPEGPCEKAFEQAKTPKDLLDTVVRFNRDGEYSYCNWSGQPENWLKPRNIPDWNFLNWVHPMGTSVSVLPGVYIVNIAAEGNQWSQEFGVVAK